MTDTQETLPEAIERIGLSIRAEFVPFSKSRNANESQRSLNWRVTLVFSNPAYGTARQGDILTTDYQAGVAHCPAYKLPVKVAGGQNSLLRARAIEMETETGVRAKPSSFGGDGFIATREAILPNAADVIYSLVQDSDVLDYRGFEDWADNFGYDSDSRKAESIYRACLEIALQLRNGIGETNLAALRAAAQDY